MIDPNTKEFHNYTDESFQYGWCGKCGHGTVLTDTDEVKEDIDRIYQRYVEEKKEEPETPFALSCGKTTITANM